LTTLESGLGDLLAFGLISPVLGATEGVQRDPSRALRLAIDKLCRDLLPHAIGLTDAFGFTDWELDRFVLCVPPFCGLGFGYGLD
jgi:acyl-CoA oxidase